MQWSNNLPVFKSIFIVLVAPVGYFIACISYNCLQELSLFLMWQITLNYQYKDGSRYPTSEQQVAVMLLVFPYQEVLVINAKPLSKVSKNQRAVLLELEMTGHVLPENTKKHLLDSEGP